MTSVLAVLLCAIRLSGVTGSELRARAFFDANNVKVGDPLVLTVDFLGSAEFRDLHPPALSKSVDRRVWRIDDASAKTDTYRDARRLTYRVRPMKEGVLWFPALEFEYAATDGERRIVRANSIPVHAKAGAQVEVAEMSEDPDKMPEPPDLVVAPPEGMSDDEVFAWRKACANPTADAFAAFPFPAARMNEARCAILEGNWARALKVYSAVEWRIGQTPEIERGIVAALARRYDNPAAELPVWRHVLRPVLRHAWPGRAGIVVGMFALVALVGWLLSRGIRALACVAAALALVLPADAQDIFQQMREMQERMERQMLQMRQSMGGFFSQIGEKEEREPVQVTASVATDRESLQVGEPFAFIVSIEAPKTVSVGQIRMVPSETFGLTVTGPAENLTDAKSANPSNVVKRLSVPVRYDVPFKGDITFSIEGMVSGRTVRNGGRFSMTFSNSFSCEAKPVAVDIRPLPSDGQPDDFSGIISEGLAVFELPDILRVETNDVVTITYRVRPKGYVPAAFLPRGAAFEWSKQTDREGRSVEIEYKRYFVADGTATTPKLKISYYDPREKKYKAAEAGGTPLKYISSGASGRLTP